MKRVHSGRFWPLLALLLLTACVDTVSPPPIASLERRRCTDESGLLKSAVRPIAVGETMTVAVDETAPCWDSPSGTSTYVAFELPEVDKPLAIKVISEPMGQTLFVPRLSLRDADGRLRRAIPREAFLPQQASLFVGIRSHPGEDI